MADQNEKLQGKTLVCNFPPRELCTGDALAAEVDARKVQDTEQKARARNWRQQSSSMAMRASTRVATMAAMAIPMPSQSLTLRIHNPPEAIVSAFCNLYPVETSKHFKLPG